MENFHQQICEVREHPLFGKDFGADVAAFSHRLRQQMIELFLREEAIRSMQDRIRRSRLPLPENIDLPLRSLSPAWRRMCVRWCKKLESWRDHSDLGRPMPDCVEILLQDFLENERNRLNKSELELKRKQTHTKRNLSYSKADDALFKRLGSDQFETLTDQELWKRHRAALTSDDYTLPKFRARAKRIRHKWRLPLNRQIKKNGQNPEREWPKKASRRN